MAYIDETGLEYFSSLVKEDINTKASIDSPALTGTPTAPTPEDSTNESQIATVGYVGSEVSSVESNVESVKSTAEKALDAANDAQSSADNAADLANTANTTAETAQKNAKYALDTANDAYSMAEKALSSLENDLSVLSSTKSVADSAEALVTKLNETVKGLAAYTNVGEVDLNNYTSECVKIYVNDNSNNLPVKDATESYFVTIDVDSNGTLIHQIATGETTSNVYIRNGSVDAEEDSEETTIEWTDWVSAGSGLFLPLKGGIMDGNLDMGDGNSFTANGLKITSEGHIVLPSGVEFF